MFPVAQKAHPNFQLEYADLNMDNTNKMWETADQVSLLTNAIPLVFVATTETLRNGWFLLYNAAVFTVNTMSNLVYHVSQVFSVTLWDESSSLKDLKSQVQPEQVVVDAIQRPPQILPQIQRPQPICEEVVQRPPQALARGFPHETLRVFKMAMRAAATARENPINEHNPIVGYLGDQQCVIWYNLHDEKKSTFKIEGSQEIQPFHWGSLMRVILDPFK